MSRSNGDSPNAATSASSTGGCSRSARSRAALAPVGVGLQCGRDPLELGGERALVPLQQVVHGSVSTGFL